MSIPNTDAIARWVHGTVQQSDEFLPGSKILSIDFVVEEDLPLPMEDVALLRESIGEAGFGAPFGGMHAAHHRSTGDDTPQLLIGHMHNHASLFGNGQCEEMEDKIKQIAVDKLKSLRPDYFERSQSSFGGEASPLSVTFAMHHADTSEKTKNNHFGGHSFGQKMLSETSLMTVLFKNTSGWDEPVPDEVIDAVISEREWSSIAYSPQTCQVYHLSLTLSPFFCVLFLFFLMF